MLYSGPSLRPFCFKVYSAHLSKFLCLQCSLVRERQHSLTSLLVCLAYMGLARLQQWEKQFLAGTTHRALHRQWTEAQSPYFCKGVLFVSPGALAGGAGFRFGTYLVTYGAVLKECRLWRPFCYSSSALLQLARVTHKQALIFIWNPDFCGCCFRDISRL